MTDLKMTSLVEVRGEKEHKGVKYGVTRWFPIQDFLARKEQIEVVLDREVTEAVLEGPSEAKTMLVEDLAKKAVFDEDGSPTLWRVQCVAMRHGIADHVEEDHVVYVLTEDHKVLPTYNQIDLSEAGLGVVCVVKVEDKGFDLSVADSTLGFGLDLTSD